VIISIDYYSFTIPTERDFNNNMFNSNMLFVTNLFSTYFNDIALQEFFSLNWSVENAKGFYRTRLRHQTTDVTLSFGSVNLHVFVELAGKACANFDSRDLLEPLIAQTADRSTRIDFAIDIKTSTKPIDFITVRKGKAFKSSGSRYSESGETEYLGSRSAERMARVYRYYPPHPRSDFLRVETEYKGNAAKVFSDVLARDGLEKTALAAHLPFGWQHADFKPADTSISRITVPYTRPQNASTVRWLYSDVITSLRRATREGLIDLEDWLKKLQEGLKDEN